MSPSELAALSADFDYALNVAAWGGVAMGAVLGGVLGFWFGFTRECDCEE